MGKKRRRGTKRKKQCRRVPGTDANGVLPDNWTDYLAARTRAREEAASDDARTRRFLDVVDCTVGEVLDTAERRPVLVMALSVPAWSHSATRGNEAQSRQEVAVLPLSHRGR